MSVALIATVDDLVLGLLIGAAIGLVAGPALRSWLTYREWMETRLETTLTDELLTRLEALDLAEPDDTGSAERDGEGHPEDRRGPVRWRTPR